MVIRKCHLAITAFFMCLLSCKADDPRLVASDLEHSSLSNTSEPIANSPAKLDLNLSAPIINATSPQPGVFALSSSVSSQPLTVAPTSAFVSSSTVKDLPIPTPSTVKPDPDTVKPTTEKPTTEKPTEKPTTEKPTTEKPTVKPTEKPTTPTTPTVPTTPSSPSTPTTASTTSSSTEKPTATTPKHNVTTVVPVTTAAPAPHHNRQFDGPSFIGGIVLASGLMAIGFVAFKFYKARTERNYHTL